jgi:hypothetical protein
MHSKITKDFSQFQKSDEEERKTICTWETIYTRSRGWGAAHKETESLRDGIRIGDG